MNDYNHYSSPTSLAEHVRNYHKSSPISSYLQEIVYGGSDGIVTTLAVISGFAGAGASNLGLSTTVVLLFGLANLFADATSMGLGNYLSVRSEKAVGDRQCQKQAAELSHDPAKTKESVEFLLQNKGYTQADAEAMGQLMMKNQEHLLEFTLSEEIGVGNSFNENPLISSVFTFGAFVSFGFLPIIPYLMTSLENQYWLAVSFAALSLIILGSVRRVVTGESWLKAIGETLLVGGLSTLVAFGVGSLFG
jgi:vacuolar iron transporter family protein